MLTSRGTVKAEPGKLDIKRRKPSILFIGLQADSLTVQLHVAIMP